jgi:hypothetical protein
MTDDIPLQVAIGAAALVIEKWLPGVKPADQARFVLELAEIVRRDPDTKPETLWISIQAPAGLGAWCDAGWSVQRAFGVFARVLVAMDEGLKPEPKPAKRKPQEGFVHATIYDKQPTLEELVHR